MILPFLPCHMFKDLLAIRNERSQEISSYKSLISCSQSLVILT